MHEQTLLAVREERRRRVAGRFLVASFVLMKPDPGVRGDGEAMMSAVAPPAPAVEPRTPVITVFHCEARMAPAISITPAADLAPMVRRVDDKELAELLSGRPHGTYLAPAGSRRRWLPDG